MNWNKIYVVTATTTVTQLFNANKKRKAFLVYNNGSYTVEFLDHKGAYGAGFPCPAGATVSDKNFNPQGELWVVSTTGNVELRVWEILSEKDLE